MRVRPFFWLLLLCVCVGVMLFSVQYTPQAPALLRVHMDQQILGVDRPAMLELNLTDPQGIPIDEVKVVSSARMTNMDMATHDSHVQRLENGHCRVQLHLYMAGPWEITITTDATGFLPQQQILNVQVE